MARTRERLAVAQKALGTLQTLLSAEEDGSDIVRDAAIQRFEYSFEATWKAAQAYLSEEGLTVASPRATVRAALEVGALSETDARRALKMVDDRNLSVHTYNEALAEAIFSRLDEHAQVMGAWLSKMEQRAPLDESG